MTTAVEIARALFIRAAPSLTGVREAVVLVRAALAEASRYAALVFVAEYAA